MRILGNVPPTGEQLPILADSGAGFRLIRGAAGSGKTTTALLRLNQLSTVRLTRRQRLEVEAPVRVLVLTYNRTLEGYIRQLAREQVDLSRDGLRLTVSTFSKWAVSIAGSADILDKDRVSAIIRPHLPASATSRILQDFYVDEIEYLLSRFLPSELDSYLGIERTGRGLSPRVDRTLRQHFLDVVVPAYNAEKQRRGKIDWNDLALQVASRPSMTYDVVIVDEAQDFSANQVRALLAHLTDDHTTTFVLDAVQRIYPRHFTWAEVGVTLRPNQIYQLRRNRRNTASIARLALPLVADLPLEDDGTLPDFSATEVEGAVPMVVSGLYSAQLSYMLDQIEERVDLTRDSVAILQPKGGGFFNFARLELMRRNLPFVELTREPTWPTGPEQIALTTIHSAKGLEFDHVLLPGLSQEVMPHGTEAGDGSLQQFRRLLAMGIGRARKTVALGYKPGEESSLVALLDPGTYNLVEV